MGWYVIKSVNCPYVLNLRRPEVRGGDCGDLILDQERGGECQLWEFDSQSRIVAQTGDALDVESWHTGGRNVIARKPVSAMNQKFKFDDDGFIVHTLTKLVLDVDEESAKCGAQLVLKERGSGSCQQWELIDQCSV